MLKRLLKNVRYFRFIDNFPGLNLGSLLVVILCTILIIIATFTQLELRYFIMPQEAFVHPSDFMSSNTFFNFFLNKYYYIPQIPAVLFAGALLGPELGLLVILFYVIAGLLGCPIFASGGGINYYMEPGFGYIIGYFVGVYIIGAIMGQKVTSLTLIKAALLGVLVIHIFGIIYMSSLLLLQHNSIYVILGWIWAKSGIQLPYDFIISFIAVGLARPVRSVLWVAMD